MITQYYAISDCFRRTRLLAETPEEALREIEENYYLRRTTNRVIRETVETLFEADPTGNLYPCEDIE